MVDASRRKGMFLARDAGAASRESALLARLAVSGYGRVDTPVLCPASVFLDFSGEEIRSSLFLAGDGSGAELCLRPEYTIPVCRAYLASDAAGRRATFSYCGPVFRSRADGPSETVQAGLESYGRSDVPAADADVLMLALDAAAAGGFSGGGVRMGDAGLLADLFDALDLPAHWRRGIKRDLDKGQGVDAVLADVPSTPTDHRGVLAALTGTDGKGARALVEDLLSIAGIATVGGRTPAEIAERFMAQVASRSTPDVASEQRDILKRFLAVEGHPDEASLAMRDLAGDAKLDIGRALDLFDERANFLAAQGLGDELTFQASFGRNLDYYTGFVFEVRRPGGEVAIGGGRYDRLAQSLGSREPIPAVGAALWVDRLGGGEQAR